MAALAVGETYPAILQRISTSGLSKLDDGAAANIPAPSASVFGPVIARFFLADDFAVYRHGTPGDPVPLAAATSNDPALDASSVPADQLTYFLVAPDGTVTDYATGTTFPTPGGCIQIRPDFVQKCDDATQFSAALDRLDGAVRTSKGTPVTAWNINAGEVSAANFAQ